MTRRKGSPDRISQEIRAVINCTGGLKKVSDLTGISVKQLSFYQTGRNKPGADTLEKLARAGRVTVDSLLGLQPAPLVREIPEPYGALERADKKTLDEVEELLRDADDDVKRHLRNQIKLLRRVQRSPKKRASGKD